MASLDARNQFAETEGRTGRHSRKAIEMGHRSVPATGIIENQDSSRCKKSHRVDASGFRAPSKGGSKVARPRKRSGECMRQESARYDRYAAHSKERAHLASLRPRLYKA